MIKPLVDLLWDDAIKRHDTFWCSLHFGHNLTSDVWFQVFGWLWGPVPKLILGPQKVLSFEELDPRTRLQLDLPCLYIVLFTS
jgi:hypothetical protein